jgi:Mn-dependent DtxR family transcriptional regulator
MDASQMDHHVCRETMERLETFVEFLSRIQSEPPWMEYFKRYFKAAELVKCKLCGQDDSEMSKRSGRKLYSYIEPKLV